jgi:hypothetical protein
LSLRVVLAVVILMVAVEVPEALEPELLFP